jgi:hypothetical protein
MFIYIRFLVTIVQAMFNLGLDSTVEYKSEDIYL